MRYVAVAIFQAPQALIIGQDGMISKNYTGQQRPHSNDSQIGYIVWVWVLVGMRCVSYLRRIVSMCARVCVLVGVGGHSCRVGGHSRHAAEA